MTSSTKIRGGTPGSWLDLAEIENLTRRLENTQLVVTLALVEVVSVLVLHASGSESVIYQTGLFLFAVIVTVCALLVARKSHIATDSGYRLHKAKDNEQRFAETVESSSPSAGLFNSIVLAPKHIPHIVLSSQDLWIVFHSGATGNIRLGRNNKPFAGPTDLKRLVKKAVRVANELVEHTSGLDTVNILLTTATQGSSRLEIFDQQHHSVDRILLVENDAVRNWAVQECSLEPCFDAALLSSLVDRVAS